MRGEGHSPTMFDVRELNVAIEIWGMAFCALGIACTILFARSERRYPNLLVALFAMSMVASGGDALAGIFRGLPGQAAWLATHVGNFATFAGNFVLLAFFTSYLCERLGEVGAPNMSGWERIVWVCTTVLCVLTLLGAFYHIDDANLYHRASFYWLTYLHALTVETINAAFVIRHSAKLGSPAWASLFLYSLVPIFAMALQVLIYGPNFLIISNTLIGVGLFLETLTHSAAILMDRTEELTRSRVELSESRIAAMVSQIQPHFLFNTLDSIYYLCVEDPSRAQTAVERFSTYLRANLDSLRKTKPVSVEAELAHVRTYLELEELSMEHLLDWSIDAQATGFMVPALALQTLTENAVKHGISARSTGGTVNVRTSEEADCWLCTIEDDGVGFDTSVPLSKEGVGIENTRARLAAMCGGTLELTSAPGCGTTAVVRIPKEGPAHSA